ncbi:hypothetical protein ACFQDN_21675 [Pseudomonas asuensis]|uniref:Uncharacterized protein n=1 Tax=Pseudomonas asuensis TaxID=1825787 RepID=A0ABQ2H1L0_9PSED|nr:hypothetical protein [Pseudomonas asuensis]GGM26450.1 hypothetical protein GCM10009425_41370 [Pseudomonas asuensis]
MPMKKIKDLSVTEWALKVQAGHEVDVSITLHPNGSGTIKTSRGEASYFHTPEDALHWLGEPETEVQV